MSNQAQKDILAYLDILVYRSQAAEWTLVDLRWMQSERNLS